MASARSMRLIARMRITDPANLTGPWQMTRTYRRETHIDRMVHEGDTLIDRGEGLVFPLEWADRGTGEAPEQMLERLR